MKKIIGALAVILSLTTSVFAYDGSSVSKSILKSFSNEFAGAQNASWQELSNGIYKVTFDYDSKNVQAFFDEKGDVIATGTTISEEHLPLLVSKALNTKYSDYSKNEFVEFTMGGETQYLVTVSKNSKTVVLKISTQGNVEVYKKMK